MNSSLFYCRILLIAILLPLYTIAQKTPSELEKVRNRVLQDPKVEHVVLSEERQTPSFIRLNKSDTYLKAQSFDIIEQYLGVRRGLDNLEYERLTKLPNGSEIVEFIQYFKGVRVEHSKFKSFISLGKIQFLSGSWYDIPSSFSITPSINSEAALIKAKQKVNARKYASDEILEKIRNVSDIKLKLELQKELANVTPKGELVIVKDFTKQGVAEPRLAYKFNIYAVDPISRAWIYIDAHNGKTLLVDPIIKHVGNPTPTSVPTTVQTRYSGTRSINVKQISGNDPNNGLPLLSSHPTTEIYIPGTATWGLIDDTRGGGIETYDLNGAGGLPLSSPILNLAFYTQGRSFTDVDNNWSLSEHKRGAAIGGAAEAENDDIAWDAHWGAGVVYDYWKNIQNRLSFDNNNGKIKSYVHTGVAYDNAYWNGSVMSYGDGSYAPPVKTTGYKALTSLDVCAHEIGHGVCEYTADLVYEKESGAMNEGFSDIWAACIEYFAIKSIDPSLAAQYKPFYIGEQISPNPANPLRRMDNPQAKGDPDTYGGTGWSNPDCAPDLVNDYCGVHTNSGVLNKWFYLLTVGSSSGSGPDASHAGEDDGINDKGHTYNVTGLGFALSEKIAYMTELLLSSTATFAEARTLSIQVAIELSGNPCGQIVKSVTNAWYAVGVGEAFQEPCATDNITFGFLQSSLATQEGEQAGCNAIKLVRVPVLMPASSTATATVSGTATSIQDYSITNTVLTNNTTEIGISYLEINIKNDAVIETDENILINLAITNTGSNAVRTNHTFTILEDDFVPIIGGGTRTLLSETFTREDGFNDPGGWQEVLEIPVNTSDPTALKGSNQWGVFGNKLAVTGTEPTTGVVFPGGYYNNVSESKTYIKSPQLDASGLTDVTISFDFRVQGEIDPEKLNLGNIDFERMPAFDYMAVMYSLDGIHFTELNSGDFKQFVSALPASGSFTGKLPASVGNRKFYIAFRWFNDTNAGGPESVSVDNLVITGKPKNIENDLNHNGRENVGPNQEVYFYSVQDNELVSKINNASSKDFGCTNSFIEKSGSGTFNLYQGRDGLHKVSNKITRIETSVSSKANTSLSFYFTEAQLTALEFATGQTRTSFNIYHVNAPAYTAAANQNTKKYAPVYTALTGGGGIYTINLNDRINGSYALGYTVSILGNDMNDITVKEQQTDHGWKFSPVYPNPGEGQASYIISSPQKEKVKLEVVNMSGQLVYSTERQLNTGSTHITIPFNRMPSGTYMIRLISATGVLLDRQSYLRK